VHQLNNKSTLMQELNDIKRKTREKRKAYWERQKLGQQPIEGGAPDKDQSEIVIPEANTVAVFQYEQPDSHNESQNQKPTRFIPRFCLIAKNWTRVKNSLPNDLHNKPRPPD